jgi:hypothetical protein
VSNLNKVLVLLKKINMNFKFYSKYYLQFFKSEKYPVIKIGNTKLLFIHINKNAGTSILTSINKKKLHLTVEELKELLGERTLNECIKFAIIRNPYDRVVSQYKHRVKTNQSSLKSENIGINKWVELTFSENYTVKYRDKKRMFLTQLEWLKDKNGVIRVDEILRFDKLKYDFDRFCEKYSLNMKLDHNNKSDFIYSDPLNDLSKTLIYNYFKEDFLHFGFNK